MIEVLLFSICLLLLGDLFFLFRIYKEGMKGKKTLFDDKYYELKYNIKLLKAISAILIFAIGFFGYSSYRDLKKSIEKDIYENIDSLNSKNEKIIKRLNNYNDAIDSLEFFKTRLYQIIKENENEMKTINQKVFRINKTLKNNPKIFIANNLKYPFNNDGPLGFHRVDSIRFNFKSMKTIFGETLPEFNKIPYINLQGYKADLEIIDITKTSVLIQLTSYFGDGHGNFPDYYYFDLWIASFE